MMVKLKMKLNIRPVNIFPNIWHWYITQAILMCLSLRWRHNGHDGVSNHQPHHCLLIRLFGCRSNKTSKLRVTGRCARNSPGTGEFPTQMASNAENVSIWWRHHGTTMLWSSCFINYIKRVTWQLSTAAYPRNYQYVNQICLNCLF